jgi:hypothetical protein
MRSAGLADITAPLAGARVARKHLSYLGRFLLRFALLRNAAFERAQGFLFPRAQLPVGVLTYVTPPLVATPSVFARFSPFVVGLFGPATVCWRRGCGSDCLSAGRLGASKHRQR